MELISVEGLVRPQRTPSDVCLVGFPRWDFSVSATEGRVVSVDGVAVSVHVLREWRRIIWLVGWLSWFARVNALCNLSRKKSREVAASLPGRFLSRRCFTLRITMETEPRTAKQYKCQYCCNYRGKGM